MLFSFTLPDIGEGVHEATVLEWKCKPGDRVGEGDPLAVIETDKVTAEIPSPRAGTVRELGVQEGGSLRVGEVLARLEIEGGQGEESASVVGRLDSSSAEILEASREGLLDGGREDTAAETTAEKAEEKSEERAPEESRKVTATPVARRLAAREGVELSDLKGSGPAGRVLKEDVLREAGRHRGAVSPEGEAAGRRDRADEVPGRDGLEGDGSRSRSERIELSTLRRTVARNLENSLRIPAAVVHDFAVVDELVQARRSLNDDSGQKEKEAPRLSYLPFFIKAAALALKRYPLLNDWYNPQETAVERRAEINIGFALDTEAGLIVPVIHQADRLTLPEIQSRVDLLRNEADRRVLRLETLREGTFTISNYGSIGGTYGRPLILPPQVAILGIGRIHQAPVARDGGLAAGHILPLSLVFDHRPVDGSYAVGFLSYFMSLVSRPVRFLASLR